MIKFNNNYYTNQLNFQRNKEKSNHKVSDESTKNSNRNSKVATGVVAASAFIAGLGANHLITPTDAYASDRFEMSAPKQNSSEPKESKDISWEQATGTAKPVPQTKKSNIPPSDKSRYYTKVDTVNIDGEPYIISDTYGIRESASLLNRTFTNLKTGKLVQTVKQNDFVSFPLQRTVTDEKGKLIESEIYEDFNFDAKAPTKGEKKVAHTDGSIDVFDVYYRVTTSLKETQNAPKKAPEKAPEKPTEDDAEDILDYLIYGGK